MKDQDRPTCVACSHVLKPEEQDLNRLTCRLCEDSVKEHLGELAGPDGLFARLVWEGTSALTPAGGRNSNDPVVKSSKTNAPAPVKIQTMNLLGAGGVVHTLQRWAGLWYDELGFRQPVWRGQHHFVTLLAPGGVPVRRPGQLDNTVRVLLNNMPWAVENRSDFGTFTHDVWRFVEDTKTALDPTIAKPIRIQVGRCPGKVGDLVCGRMLTADPFAAAIRCANCGTHWNRSQWMELGRTMRTG